MLSLHSTVLATACVGSSSVRSYVGVLEMAEGLTLHEKDANDNEIDLCDEDPDCVDALIFYLYHLNYDERAFTTPAYRLMFHVQMCVLAEKFQIEPLQTLAVEKFTKHLEEMEVSEHELTQCATIAYENYGGTVELRQQIVKAAIVRKLFMHSTSPYSEFEQAMITHPHLAIGIVKAQQGIIEARRDPIDARRGPMQFKCPDKDCGSTFIRRVFVEQESACFACPRCEKTFTGSQWLQHIVEDRD